MYMLHNDRKAAYKRAPLNITFHQSSSAQYAVVQLEVLELCYWNLNKTQVLALDGICVNDF